MTSNDNLDKRNENSNNNNDNGTITAVVPLVAGRGKKKQVKKPRIRPTKKKKTTTTAVKRKANKNAGTPSASTVTAAAGGSKKSNSNVGSKLVAKEVGIVSPSPTSQALQDEDDKDGNEKEEEKEKGEKNVVDTNAKDGAEKDVGSTREEAAKQIDGNVISNSNQNSTPQSADKEKGETQSADKAVSDANSTKKDSQKSATPSTVKNPSAATSSRRTSNSTTARKRKIIPRGKPITASKGRPIRPTGSTASAANQLRSRGRNAISIGSSIIKPSSQMQKSSNSISAVPNENNQSQNNAKSTNSANVSQELVPVSQSNHSSTSNTTSDKNNDNKEIIPYQHLGQLDPAWNIPPPKEDEKTMKDYCSAYLKKLPRELRKRKNVNKENDPNDTNGTNDSNNSSNNRKRRRNRSSNSRDDNETTTTGDAAGNSSSNNNNNNASSSSAASTTSSKPNNEGIPIVEVINGEIVIKEATVIVGERQTIEEVDREMGGTVVVEDNNALTATYRSFKTNEKTLRWTVEETRNFYVALRQCGTDFTTMMSFFDGSSDDRRKRSRKQLKSKYNLECRKNLKLIDMAMNPRVSLPLDLTKFGELDMENLTTSVTPIVHEESTITASSSTTTDANANNNSKEQSVITEDEDANTPFETVFEDEEEILKQRESSVANFQRWDADMGLNSEKNGGLDNITNLDSNSNRDTLAVTPTPPAEEEKEDVGEEKGLTTQIALTIPGGNKKKKKKFRVKPKPGPKGKSKAKAKPKPKPKKAVK